MTTTKTKPAITRTPCIDGSFAHRWSIDDPGDATGGIAGGICDRCQQTRTFTTAFINDVRQIVPPRAKRATAEGIDG